MVTRALDRGECRVPGLPVHSDTASPVGAYGYSFNRLNIRSGISRITSNSQRQNQGV